MTKTITKNVLIAPKELSTFVRSINPKEKLELSIEDLNPEWDWYFLTKTKKTGAYFVETKPTRGAVFIIGMSKSPSSVVIPIIYYVKDLDTRCTIATVYNPQKVQMSKITLLELYILYGFFIGTLSNTYKIKKIKKEV